MTSKTSDTLYLIFVATCVLLSLPLIALLYVSIVAILNNPELGRTIYQHL